MKKISFIIPVYNCKEFLTDCIKSLRAAKVQDCEILLIDDGSTDGSGALCDELAETNPEIRVIHQENRGVSAARNRGIEEAQGKLILFIDADDSIDSAALGKVLSDPRCQENDLTIFGLTFDYYKNGKCYRRDPMCFPEDGILTRQRWGESFVRLYEQNAMSPVWNKVFSREILLRNELKLNEYMFLYEDLEFVLRYLPHCDRIWNVPQAIYHYRQAEDEGNAGRRLSRIASLPEFLMPIEEALENLCSANPAVTRQDTDSILQSLYLCLAREKISVSDLKEIRQICRDFAHWTEKHQLPQEESGLQKKLMEERALSLWLRDKKLALRHRVAVWVKSHLCRI